MIAQLKRLWQENPDILTVIKAFIQKRLKKKA